MRIFKQKDLEHLTDEELVERFRSSGRNEIVGLLYTRYTHLIFGLCLKYLKNEADARDMVMQIFEKLMVDLKTHEISYFRGWIYSVARNACLMELRKVQRGREKEADLLRHETERMESDDFGHLSTEDLKEQQLETLDEAMDSLSEEQRRCIDLFYLKKHSYAEVAERTGFSLKQVKSYLQNGKRNLKLYLLKAHGRKDP